jgi:hypothetical protein
MIDLIARAPDSWQLVEPYGHPPSILFYYGVLAGESHLLPLERSYKQVKRRQLTRFEVPHFEALWLEIMMMGRKAG